MPLYEYIDQFRKALERLLDFGLTESFDFKQEIRPGKQATINAEVILINETILYIRAYISAKYKISLLSYAFQYQSKDGKLIFRYDNATHKPPLGFEEHKHMENGDIIEASSPDPRDLVDEIIESFC